MTETSNKGRGTVLAAACVTMFFISSIALYSVVSKNLLAVYPEWSGALTWAFPVFQTIMAVTGIFAGRISDKIGPRNIVMAAAACYGVGWFMCGTVTEPWQFYLWFSLVAAIGNGLGYNPALTTGQKWFIDKKGLASGITLAASTAGPAVLSPVLASALIPAFGIFGALRRSASSSSRRSSPPRCCSRLPRKVGCRRATSRLPPAPTPAPSAT